MPIIQKFKLYNIANRYFKNEADATSFVKEIGGVIDNKFDMSKDILATKEDISSLRIDAREQKVDIIKWMVAMWIAQMAAIVFMIIKK